MKAKKKRLSVEFEVDLKERAEVFAKKDRRSLASLLHVALEKYLDDHERKAPRQGSPDDEVM